MPDRVPSRILVVEHRGGQPGALSEYLSRTGSDLRRVIGVAAACALLRDEWFPVVVAHLPAPGTEALALLRAAQRTQPRTAVVFRFDALEGVAAAFPAIRTSSATILGPGTTAEEVKARVDDLLRELDIDAVTSPVPPAPIDVDTHDGEERLTRSTERYRSILRPLEAIARLANDDDLERVRSSIARSAREATRAEQAWAVLLDDGRGDLVIVADPPTVDAPRAFVREVCLAARPLSALVPLSDRRHLGAPIDGNGSVRGALVVAIDASREPSPSDEALLVALARELAAGERIARLQREIASARDTAVIALTNALELRDRETSLHSQRVALLAYELAVELRYDDDALLEELRAGALLHDVGKIGIPLPILRKDGPLTDDEWIEMQRHPEYGWRLLQGIPHLTGAAELVFVSHERWDGQGYPRGLAGDEIPVAARIFSVADAWDSMTSDRPYRRALPLDEALHELSERAGSQFDPEVVEAFFRVIARRIRERRGDYEGRGQPAA